MSDIREILNFITIAELGTFSRASEALNIAQPALSQQIKNLELSLQRQLLLRHSRGVELTEAGKAFLISAKLVREKIARAHQAIADVAGATGFVSIGMTLSSVDTFFSGLTSWLHENYPKINLRIVQGTTRELEAKLRDDELDMSVLSKDIGNGFVGETLVSSKLALLSSILMRPDGEQISLRELSRYPLILPPRTSVLRMRLEREANKQGVKLDIALEVQSEALMRRLAGEGYGYAVLPYYSALPEAELHRLHVTEIVKPCFISNMYLTYNQKVPLGLAAKAVRNGLNELAREKRIGAQSKN